MHMVFQSFSESLHPRADDDFRRDIKRLCSKYEQDYVSSANKVSQTSKASVHPKDKENEFRPTTKKQKNVVTKKHTFVHPAPKETVNENDVTKVSKRINKKLKQLITALF